MIKIFIYLLMMIFSIFMLFMNHPLAMGLMILIQTLLMSMILGMFMKTYWFSYILFLTFLGGLLVLFIYVSSVASNELFIYSFKMNLFFIFSIIMSMIMSFMFKNNLNFLNLYLNNEMLSYFYMFFFNNENKMNLSKLYNNQTYFLMIILIIYLFITLITVVKITNIFFGPLRSNS